LADVPLKLDRKQNYKYQGRMQTVWKLRFHKLKFCLIYILSVLTLYSHLSTNPKSKCQII